MRHADSSPVCQRGRPRGLRCIGIIEGNRRCGRPVARRSGDLMLCTRHTAVYGLLLEDATRPEFRRRMAQARWNTYREGVTLGRVVSAELDRKEVREV